MPSPIRLLLLAPLLAWSLAPAPAEACSVVTPGDFEVDDTLDDANPPAAIEGEVSVSVKRGVGPVSSAGGVQGSSSCDDIGQLVLSWQAAVDAEAGEGSGGYELQPGVGYRFAVVEGTLPDGLSIPQHAQSAFFDVDSGGASTIFVIPGSGLVRGHRGPPVLAAACTGVAQHGRPSAEARRGAPSPDRRWDRPLR